MEAWGWRAYELSVQVAHEQRVEGAVSTVHDWLGFALCQINDREPSFASEHLDELGYTNPSWPSAVQALSKASEGLPPTWVGRLSLALPLSETPKLCTRPPADLSAQADEFEPPSLYLFGRGYFDLWGMVDGEEYRASVRPPQDLADERFEFEFVSWRSAESAAGDWYYVNVLWVHFTQGRHTTPRPT